jgi:hypothetical protein
VNFASHRLAQGVRPQSVLSIVFFVCGLVAAYVVAETILAEDFSKLAFAGMACVAAAIVAVTAINWRTGLYLLLAWLLLEDLARKYLGNNMAIYFAKDFLLAVVYASFFASWRRKDPTLKTFRPPFLRALLVLIWFAFIQVFNPASTTIFYGLMGMKLYFYYVPLIVVGYALADSEATLRRFFYFNLSLIGVIVSLGIVQAILGPGFLNPAVMAEDIRELSGLYRIAPITHTLVYRPTSVFVSAGRFGDLLIVSWLIVFGFSGYLLLRHRKGRIGRIFTLLVLALTAAGCLMCASRGVFVWSALSGVAGALAFLWGAPWRQGQALRVVRIVQRAAIGVAVAVLVLLFIYPEAFLGRIAVLSETLDPRSPRGELFSRSQDYPLAEFSKALNNSRWPYGNGLGTASLGGQYISRFFGTRPPEYPVESGYGDIVLEMGIVGLALWLVMSAAVVVSGWRVVRKLKGSPFFPLAFMILLYAFLLLVPMTFVAIQAYQDFVLNCYLWLLVGILFRLPTLQVSGETESALNARSGARVPPVPLGLRQPRTQA